MRHADRAVGRRHLGLGRQGHVGHGRLRPRPHRGHDRRGVGGLGRGRRDPVRHRRGVRRRRERAHHRPAARPRPGPPGVARAGHQVHADAAEAAREGRAAVGVASLDRAARRRPRRPVPDPRSDQPAVERGAGRRARRGGRRGAHPCGRRVELLDARRPSASTPRSRRTACRWPRTRSSTRCCAAGPRRPACCETCRHLGVVLLAYSPIGQGRLTGKYSAANPPPGKRNFSAHPMEEVDRVVAVLRRIGERPRAHARARSRCGGSSTRARCRSPAPRTASRPGRTPARSAGR